MIIVTVLTLYAFGLIFAPAATRAVLKALTSLIGTLAVILLVFWRICPSTTRTIRRF